MRNTYKLNGVVIPYIQHGDQLNSINFRFQKHWKLFAQLLKVKILMNSLLSSYNSQQSQHFSFCFTGNLQQ